MSQYQNPNQYQYQYQQPIRWGLIIVWFIFFFPLGFYFLMREYRNKRPLNIYGKVLKRTGIVCIGIGIFYMIFYPLVLETSSDGTILTTSQKLGYGFLMLALFGILGMIFFINGLSKSKAAAGQAAMQVSYNQNVEFEASHPFTDGKCPNCGAHIRGRKGIAEKCEYCGNEIIL